jgi:hypothetical protein
MCKAKLLLTMIALGASGALNAAEAPDLTGRNCFVCSAQPATGRVPAATVLWRLR